MATGREDLNSDFSTEIEPSPLECVGEHFNSWWSYFGELHQAVDDVDGEPRRTIVYGFESETDPSQRKFIVPDLGGCYGYVIRGGVSISDARFEGLMLQSGDYFCTPAGFEGTLAESSRIVVCQLADSLPLRVIGGPLEGLGRLRYIDRCSDTVLVHPARRGDACLNHLHFPSGVEQTEHTHPSVRAGAVSGGQGWCETPDGLIPLITGLIFSIPADGRHRFVTSHRTMDVVAYHPDSDFGPTDEDHPMVNRTWVDGQKIDNTEGIHTSAELQRSQISGGDR